VSDDKREMTLTSCGERSIRIYDAVVMLKKRTIDSTVCTGIHLSPASSYPY
jgi:hypothetical protein